MTDDAMWMGPEPGAHAGVVVLRPDAPRHRGTLLLNLAESKGRIKHLPGFR